MNRDEHIEVLAERYSRLVREAHELVRRATLDVEGQAVVPIAQLNRLRRELKGEPQPSAMWMSVT